MYAVTFMGYWAYGSVTSTYLLNSVGGPAWVKTMANVAAFLQTVIALHVILPDLVPLLILLVSVNVSSCSKFCKCSSTFLFIFFRYSQVQCTSTWTPSMV